MIPAISMNRMLRAALVSYTLLPIGTGAVCAQAQDSVTAPMGPQATVHPPPLLSSIAATLVPSDNALPPIHGTAAPKVIQANTLDLPGPLQLTAPVRLACSDIADHGARSRCESRHAAPAPPRGEQR